MTNRAMGMGAMLGFGVSAIKEQFKVPSQDNAVVSGNNGDSSGTGLKGFVNRAKSIINPSMNLSDEKDYNGNVNPIRNVIPNESKIENRNSLVTNSNTINTQNNNNTSNMQINSKGNTFKTVATNVAKTGVGVAKTYYKIGEQMAEGDFKRSSFNNNIKNNYYQSKNDFQNTEYMNRVAQNNYSNKEIGDENGNRE